MPSFSALTVLFPIDGRYVVKANPLCEWLPKTAFMRNYVKVKVR